MEIQWTKSNKRYEYYHGTTDTRFSAQIGMSTNHGKYAWMVFHSDFLYAVGGGETSTLEKAKDQAAQWIDDNANATQP